MDEFQKIAQGLVLYRLRTGWLEISKMFNSVATEYGGTMSMGFVLLTINDEYGTPVTRIAPRMGMEPNSLSRLLKKLEAENIVYRIKVVRTVCYHRRAHEVMRCRWRRCMGPFQRRGSPWVGRRWFASHQ